MSDLLVRTKKITAQEGTETEKISKVRRNENFRMEDG